MNIYYWGWRAGYIFIAAKSGRVERVHDWEVGADGVERCRHCGKVYQGWG